MNRHIKKMGAPIAFLAQLLLAFLASYTSANATAGASTVPTVYTDVTDFLALLTNITSWLFAFAMTFAVIMVLWGGYLYLTARDDEKQIEKAKHTMIYAVIGVAIAIFASGMPKLIGTFLGT